MRPMVYVNNLRKAFGKNLAIDGLSLSVSEGSIYGLVGPNGAGKSTLLNIIAGVMKQDSGDVRIGDCRTQLGDRLGNSLGFVLDRPFYIGKLTASEFLDFCGSMRGLEQEELESRKKRLLSFFDISMTDDSYIETFSKGIRQKISIAAAVIHNPDILILDEPFDGLDVTSTESVCRILRQSKLTGTTILVTSHMLELVQGHCDYYGILDRGKLVFECEASKLESQLGDRVAGSLREILLSVISTDTVRESLPWLQNGDSE